MTTLHQEEMKLLGLDADAGLLRALCSSERRQKITRMRKSMGQNKNPLPFLCSQADLASDRYLVTPPACVLL